MEDIENILRKIKDLMNSKPKTLDFLIDEKNKKIKSISALKESVSNNNLKKYTIEKEIETLNREKTILLGLLNIAKNEDIEFIVKTLNLSLDVDHDLYALHNYFPLQIKIRQDIINELAKLIKDDLDKLDNINKEINELDIKYKSISTNQFKLVKLIKRVLNKDTSITRDEVLSILKSVAFDEEESYVAAKLILFPERELIPYFEGFNIEFKEPTEQIIDISYSDTVKKDKELENEDTSLEEDIKEEPIYENNILVSLDQMRSLIENNMNEMYKKKSLKKKQKDNRNILEQIGKNKSDLSLFEGVSFNIDTKMILNLEERGLDPIDISIVIYRYGIDKYLENLDTLESYGYNVTEMELEKFGVNLALTDKDMITKNLEVLHENGLTLEKTNKKLALSILSVDTDTLKENIKEFIEIKEKENLKNNVEILRCNVKNIINKILYCKQNGISYIKSKKYDINILNENK